ncbi:MAG: FmdB family zinc ribbon protein [Thermodesulfobacteriota bacterium]
MPIYEFFCHECNMIFNFFSKRIDTTTRPRCPKCLKVELDRKVSPFAVTGRAKEGDDMDDLPFDESKMEQAMNLLAGEADKINENDPRQAAQLMRKLTDMTGIGLGPGMEAALRRMEQGEDPEAIEAEMGDIIENEEPFLLPEKKGGKGGIKSLRPQTDPVLYDLHPEA